MRFKLIQPLTIILFSIIITFLTARFISYLVISSYLPQSLFLSVNGFKLHHFVYGNILIIISAFLLICFDKISKNWLALIFGVGLGLVLDEFLLWVGSVENLTKVELFVPYSLTVILIICFIIVVLLIIKYWSNFKK